MDLDPKELTAVAAVIQALATVILLVVTVVYVWFTRRMAGDAQASAAAAERSTDASERSMRAQLLPVVDISVNPMPIDVTNDGRMVPLDRVPYVLENLGVAAAFNISPFMLPTEGGQATDTQNVGFGIGYPKIEPGERVEGTVFNLGPRGTSGSGVSNPSDEFRRRLLEEDWEVVVEYEDALGHKYQRRRNYGHAGPEWMSARTLRFDGEEWVPLVR